MSKIEWTEQTWNPVIGCSKVSPGCANCYAEKMACRLANMAASGGNSTRQYCEVTDISVFEREYSNPTGWNGKTAFVESQLNKPLRRKKPTTYFVCSMGDLFHETAPFEWIDRVFAVMALCQQHTFQVLTKRPERMEDYLNCHYPHDSSTMVGIRAQMHKINPKAYTHSKLPWPLPNVWIGTTVENKEQANKRIPHLLKCPAAIRFLSVEPMLGPVDIASLGWRNTDPLCDPRIDWVICGGESGHNARPMHPDWVRSIRDQCKAASVPFFFKQWGEWCTAEQSEVFSMPPHPSHQPWLKQNGETPQCYTQVYKIGKKDSGCRIDGKEHKEMPFVW